MFLNICTVYTIGGTFPSYSTISSGQYEKPAPFTVVLYCVLINDVPVHLPARRGGHVEHESGPGGPCGSFLVDLHGGYFWPWPSAMLL